MTLPVALLFLLSEITILVGIHPTDIPVEHVGQGHFVQAAVDHQVKLLPNGKGQAGLRPLALFLPAFTALAGDGAQLALCGAYYLAHGVLTGVLGEHVSPVLSPLALEKAALVQGGHYHFKIFH